MSKLPQIQEFSDYHEIEGLDDRLRLLGLRLKCVEAGFYCGKYIGIIYQRKDKAFKALLKRVEADTDSERTERMTR